MEIYDGWDAVMCRYRFGDGNCAYPSNMALECVGEENCQFVDNSEDRSPPEPSPGEMMSEDMSKASSEDDLCPHTKTGIYCKKHGHFHCAGKENCQTREDYMKHMEKHQDKVQNVDIEKRYERD